MIKNTLSHKSYMLLILPLLILSCQRDSNFDSLAKININPQKSICLKASDVFDSIELIELKSDSNIVFVKPVRLNVNEGLYYLLSDDVIVVFDSLGNNVMLFDRKGHGPTEYLNISDFLIESDNLFINDREGRRLLVYDLNGNIIESFKHDLLAYNFIKIGGVVYLNSGNLINAQTSYRINKYDLSSKSVTAGYINQITGLDYLSVIEFTNFSLFGDTLSYSQSFSNVIYHLSEKGGVTPRFEIDFGKHNLTDDFLLEHKTLRAFFENLKVSDYATRIDGYSENEANMFFMYSYQNKKPFVIYNKKEHRIYNFDRFTDDFLFPDIVQTTSYSMMPLLVTERYMYISLDSHQFIKLYELST